MPLLSRTGLHHLEMARNQTLRWYASFKRLKADHILARSSSQNNDGNVIPNIPEWASEASLYIHWPYCEKRCTYCNFNKYISQSVNHERMKKCLITEIETMVQKTYVKKIKSIFFGGGTPSLAPASTIAAVVKRASELCDMPSSAEVTLEANPTSTEMRKLRDFKEAGVNRISVGLQALNDKDLKILGRQHSVNEALRCLDQAKSIFPGRTSVDLIFGRPGQNLSSWQKELEKILELCDNHISLYQLTLERGTSLFKEVTQRILTLPTPDEMADMYELTVDTLEASGFRRYEASNFAREGADSSHNQSYWRGNQYIGIGPGAHGRLVMRPGAHEFTSWTGIPAGVPATPGREATGRPQRWALTQTLEPVPWMAEVESKGHAMRRAQPQTQSDILEEILMLGLRTAEGLPQERWQRMGGTHMLEDLFGSDLQIRSLIDNGLLHLDHRGLGATRSGLNVIDNITTHLIYLLQSSLQNAETSYNPSERLRK